MLLQANNESRSSRGAFREGTFGKRSESGPRARAYAACSRAAPGHHRPALRPDCEDLTGLGQAEGGQNTRQIRVPGNKGLELSHRGDSRWRVPRCERRKASGPRWDRFRARAHSGGNVCLSGADQRTLRLSALRLPSAYSRMANLFCGFVGMAWQSSGASASRGRIFFFPLPLCNERSSGGERRLRIDPPRPFVSRPRP